MCNLYSLTTNQQAIRDFASISHDLVVNLEPDLDVYPDRPAPVIRQTADGREMSLMTWGMPTPPQFLKTPDAPDRGVTNIRNTGSPHWRRWLAPANRCVIPATAFSEYGATPDPMTRRKSLHWFAEEKRPLFFFAGLWTDWTGTRGSTRSPRMGEHRLYAFLTTASNAVVGRVHPKAMPVILTQEDEIETWLNADWQIASQLQRPLPDGDLIELEA